MSKADMTKATRGGLGNGYRLIPGLAQGNAVSLLRENERSAFRAGVRKILTEAIVPISDQKPPANEVATATEKSAKQE